MDAQSDLTPIKHGAADGGESADLLWECGRGSAARQAARRQSVATPALPPRQNSASFVARLSQGFHKFRARIGLCQFRSVHMFRFARNRSNEHMTLARTLGRLRAGFQ